MDQHKKDKIKARELDERITKIENFLWSESGYAAGGSVSGAHNEVPEGEASRKAREGAEAASDRGAVVDPDACERLGAAYRAVADAPAPSAPEARCTCPSGDGSLRWPCPVHPPEADTIRDGFSAADMMDARQEGRKEAQQPAAGAVLEGIDWRWVAHAMDWYAGCAPDSVIRHTAARYAGMFRSFAAAKLDADGRVHQTVAAKGDDRAGEGRVVAKLPEARNP